MISATLQPDFTDPAIRLGHMRNQLRPYWTPIEAGGVFLLADVDEIKYWQFLEDFYSLPEAVEAASDKARIMVLSDLLSRDARRFFELAELAPGTYELENYHLDYAQDGKLAFSVYDDEHSEPFTLPAERSFVFELTAEHLKLLRHMNTRDWSGYIEAMDPKRPYGDMTYHYIDMADALGEGPLARNADGYADEALGKRYDKLHQEMLFAIQAFWQYAEGGIDAKVIRAEKRVREFRCCFQQGDLAGAEALYVANSDLQADFLTVVGGANPANQTSRNVILGFTEHILKAEDASLWLQAGRAASASLQASAPPLPRIGTIWRMPSSRSWNWSARLT